MRRAVRCQGACEYAEAKELYKRILAVQPENAHAVHNLGWIAYVEGNVDAALRLIHESLRISPDTWFFHFNLARILHNQMGFAKSAAHYESALALNPSFAGMHNEHGILMIDQGDAGEAVRCFERAIAANPLDAMACSNYLHAINQLPGMSHAAIFDAHVRFALRFARDEPTSHATPRANDPARRIRLGYVSGDFRENTVAWFIEPVFANHDHASYEVFGYSNCGVADVVTARLRNHVDHWRNIAPMSDAEAVSLVQSDAIDILIDLSGHTRDNRLPMFAYKPAPLQVSWLGYFNTTGLSTIDYLISDPVLSPPDSMQPFSETVVRLPHTRLCYQPPAYAPDVAPLPARAKTFITFGTFNKLAKLNDLVLSLWANVLRGVPGSRLLLKARAFADEAVQQAYRERFGKLGIAAERLLLRPYSAHADMLAEYADIDIALDPSPFSGGLTTCEALWQGVPVLTLRGESLVARQSASFLTALGLDDWIADSQRDYVARATRRAGDLESLASLRATLRERMRSSPMCDATAFTRDLERVYRKIWEMWCVE